MGLVRTEDIKEIAVHISQGVLVFVHKSSRKIMAMPEPEEGKNEWKAQCDKLEADDKNWLKIKTISMDDEIHLRKGFILEATDQHVKKQLTNALNRKKPLRNFTQVVESDEILNQHWRNYRKVAYQDWVSNYIIEAYNY